MYDTQTSNEDAISPLNFTFLCHRNDYLMKKDPEKLGNA